MTTPKPTAPLIPEREAEIRERAAAEKSGHLAIRALLAELDRVRAERDAFADRVDELKEQMLTAQGDVASEALRTTKAEAERDELKKRVAVLDGRLNEAAMTRVWTNEDGKKFVFLEDIAPALLGLNQGPVR